MKNKSNRGVSNKELKDWLEKGIRKGYDPHHLKAFLINHGLHKEAERLDSVQRNYHKKNLVILSFFALILIFSLFMILSNGSFQSGGYIILESENPGALINVDFSDEIGIVRDDFYGVNTWGRYLNDTDVWSRQMFLDSGMKYIRGDMSLEDTISETEFVDEKVDESTRLISWARNNGLKVLWIASYMPEWLANTTQGWCESSDNSTCPPTNYTAFGNLVVNFLTEIGCDSSVCEVEVWNEPSLAIFWMSDVLPETTPIRSIEYNKLYNATYNSIKSVYSNMQIGGPATTGKNPDTSLMMLNWMSNFSNQIDFVSHHHYLGQNDGFNNYYPALEDTYSWILANITNYNVNTSRILIDEYNVWNDTIRSDYSDEWANQMAQSYAITLNNYPKNISLMSYVWTGSKFQMVNVTDNTTEISYNVTKNFATYHSSGSTIVKSNSSSGEIKVVASKKDNTQYITVINTGVEINLGMNLFGEEFSQVKDLETQETYNVTEGGVYLGNISQYKIRYFTNITNSQTPEEELEETPRGSSSGHRTVEEPAQCDEAYLNTTTCVDLGYASGTLSYGPECTLDTSKCIPYTEEDLQNQESIEQEDKENVKDEGIIKNNQETGKNKIGNSFFSKEKRFSSLNIILYCLFVGILVLIFFIIRIVIQMRKHK